MAGAIRIDGLNELVRNLKKMDRTLPKAVRLGMNDAVNIVVDDVKPKVPMLTGAAKRSVRGASTTKLARIRAGGKRVPYFGWLDFGGRVGRKASVHRARVEGGRYLWKTFTEKRGEVEDALADNLHKIIIEAGLNPTRGA